MTKLGRVVALQVVLISAAVAAGIYITNTIVEDFLITEALQNEASHYWSLYAENPNQPLPDTANMRGFLVDPLAGPKPMTPGTVSTQEQLLQLRRSRRKRNRALRARPKARSSSIPRCRGIRRSSPIPPTKGRWSR